MRFAIFIDLGGCTLSSTELFRAIQFSAALLGNYFWGHIARYFFKIGNTFMVKSRIGKLETLEKVV